jgi:hypothetical protein
MMSAESDLGGHRRVSHGYVVLFLILSQSRVFRDSIIQQRSPVSIFKLSFVPHFTEEQICFATDPVS